MCPSPNPLRRTQRARTTRPESPLPPGAAAHVEHLRQRRERAAAVRASAADDSLPRESGESDPEAAAATNEQDDQLPRDSADDTAVGAEEENEENGDDGSDDEIAALQAQLEAAQRRRSARHARRDWRLGGYDENGDYIVPHDSSNPWRRPRSAPRQVGYFSLYHDEIYNILKSKTASGAVFEYEVAYSSLSYMYDWLAAVKSTITDDTPDIALQAYDAFTEIYEFQAARLGLIRIQAKATDKDKDLLDYLREKRRGPLDGLSIGSSVLERDIAEFQETFLKAKLKESTGRAARGPKPPNHSKPDPKAAKGARK